MARRSFRLHPFKVHDCKHWKLAGPGTEGIQVNICLFPQKSRYWLNPIFWDTDTANPVATSSSKSSTAALNLTTPPYLQTATSPTGPRSLPKLLPTTTDLSQDTQNTTAGSKRPGLWTFNSTSLNRQPIHGPSLDLSRKQVSSS